MTYKKFYTARELAALQLPGWPTHVSNFIARAKKEEWVTQPRIGRGGGVVYPFASLPVELQKAILFKMADNSGLKSFSDTVAVMAPEDAAPRINGTDRRSAKLIIIGLFKKYRDASGMPVLAAETTFTKLYVSTRETPAPVAPKWVYEIYSEFSVQSLRRWRTLGESDVQSLGGRYGNRKDTGILLRANDGAVANFIAAAIVAQTHIKAGHIRDLCRAHFGETLTVTDARTGEKVQERLPKIRAFERHIAAWKVEHADMHEKMVNPDSYKNKRMLALGDAAAGIKRLNQVWEIDASPADALCIDGRYTVYAIIDVWSRRALFSVSKTARTEAALLLLRRAIMEWGVPEILKTDNGSDFVSKRFTTSLLTLSIVPVVCPPYSPERKPHVESVIRTMQHDLMAILPGFAGHNVADRRQIEAKKTFAQSLGETNEKTFQISLTHVELQQRLDDWAEHKYSQRAHRSLKGKTPFAVGTSWTQPIRKIENIRALDLLLAPLAGTDGYRVIGKKGLRIDNGHFYGPGIELYVGKRVMVRHDPEDMGRVYVFSEDNEFICEATDINRLGAHPARAAAEAKARQKNFFNEKIKSIRKEMRKITPEYISEQILSLAARDAAKVTSFPKQSEAYTTPALEEAHRATSKDAIPSERTEQQKENHEAFVLKFMQRQEKVAAKAESDTDRWWNRAMAIEAQLAAGAEITAQDREWLEGVAHQSTWYKPRKRHAARLAATETTGV